MKRLLAAACVLALALCASCAGTSEPSEPPESSVVSEASSAPSESSASAEGLLPPVETILLVYTDYITAQTTQNGIAYTYTYCFDGEGKVFNAEADLRFPDEASSLREYRRLRALAYPNLEREGTTVHFCFPRKECPFYGVSYRALEVLLAEETVYEVVDCHPPEPPTPSESSAA